MRVGDEAVLHCQDILGPDATQAMARATAFLRQRDSAALVQLVGQTVPSLAIKGPAADKRSFPASYGGGKPCGDDLLGAAGVFYVTESGRVMLDCTSGHYQMTWGYDHPDLTAAAVEGMQLGVVWDNHSNIPSLPVKMLAQELVALTEGTGLDRVLLGAATGSVACGAALKIMLKRYFDDADRSRLGPPVVLTLAGNYHGTDIVAQTLRGMWPGLLAGVEPIQIEPNEPGGLREVFQRYGRRIAGFWAEPIMMNREAILVEADFLHLARDLCSQHDALMVLDEIQTCFWYPEVFYFRRLGLSPDLVVIGKGMTAGFHPLAGLLYRRDLDILEQYDAISTNGNASLAALVGLCNLRLLARDRDRIAALGQRYFAGLEVLARDFPDVIEGANGSLFLAGLKFRDRDEAIAFHRAAAARGLWLRVHAYHPGHRTILAKFALAADETVIDFVLEAVRDLLVRRPWRRG